MVRYLLQYGILKNGDTCYVGTKIVKPFLDLTIFGGTVYLFEII
ncbi:Hypothetical protein I595_3512 [Croceitalea dokdonensis DOKDO 023]|uniref:Uncharacterized protein n=1 Tax=Croceitalea dokdonensis DOKDO 023 TaxID=1300341 RepID=A0A0P7ARB4_9FLAO|nr:Hypothetical protein I595_3512 [Croceitalea dokdonensis DOKDO 023]